MYGHVETSPRKRRVGNIGSPPKPKLKRVGLLTRIWKKIRKSPEKSRLNSLPPELVGHIGKFLPRRNLETLSRMNTRIANNAQKRAQNLRNLEIRLAQTGGQIGRRFIEVVNNMKKVAPQNNVTLGWESRLMNTNRLIRNLKYSHPNANGRGNIFKRIVRQRVMRRGRMVNRMLPEYYLLITAPGGGLMLNRINIPPYFRSRRIAVNLVRNGNKLSLPLSRRRT